MLKHHDAELDRALDRLYVQGAVAILWIDLYLWFNAHRLSKGAYREILRRWKELCTVTYGYSKAPKLSILKTSMPYLIIYRDVFKEDDEEIMPFEAWT